MTRLRRSLGPIAAVWLVCQTSIVVMVPAVFWAASAEELLECTCTHGDHAMCPMHHKPAPGSPICLMRSANDSGTAVLTALFGAAGVLPAASSVAAPVPIYVLIPGEPAATSLRPAPPDPPPPRA